MQRRAAALYAVLLLVIGVASFSLISVATPPELAFEDPDHELSESDEFTLDGTTYTVDTIDAEMQSSGGGGGHGGGGGGAELVRSGTIVWTNESALATETWGNGSEVTYQNDTYVAEIEGPNDTDVTLREVIDRTAILQNDSSVLNETQTVDGTEYVVREADDGTRTLLPTEEYFPEPETYVFDGGESVQFAGEEFTVAAVSADEARLSRVSPEEVEISVSNHANVTVGDQRYFAHFPDNDTLVLSDDYTVYQQYQNDQDTFKEHENGMWGVSIVTVAGATFLIALAFLPTRY
ncbi:hypothetical protein RYH80_09770 [Halobaculum sp. MBLA0147]|uniref:hypothetical protein n=1 Tax=Halobaculum sp. MBLA0147 TaxID=3079934 RepID=UPI0035237ED8